MNTNKWFSIMLAYLTGVAGLLALVIIGTICYTAIAPGVSTDNKALAQLQNWGGVVIGFFFGSFFNLFSEAIKGKTANESTQSEQPGSGSTSLVKEKKGDGGTAGIR